jgi:hypothetical protein
LNDLAGFEMFRELEKEHLPLFLEETCRSFTRQDIRSVRILQGRGRTT